ncbi:hypothetical protein E1B28_011666 [Marasmius oreades]|uniref:Uncharacterized protein n=1 Tax=Marasmius oreades TaxID=181124 RepID=A0A9P7UPU2_9AGAR|nr:uncharacterized protein E1B28_011666 [Marasmius oreades]KAG7090047.1 hypothetical protein E1B28_011666 [Marasmius oreades]
MPRSIQLLPFIPVLIQLPPPPQSIHSFLHPDSPPHLQDQPSKMEILTGASKVKIGRGNFSSVGRDQFNYTIVQTRDKRTKVARGLPELSEFTEIKRGDIYKDKDVCYSWQLCSNGKENTEAAVYIAQIMIGGRFGESKFTVKTYHGRNATKEWSRDFSRCSKDWLRDVPLFGYNKSSVPSLIFCGELVPVAHMEARMGSVGLFYMCLLRSSLGCSRNEIWMDPAQGRLCRGPVGPKCRNWPEQDFDATVPSDMEFLKEDTIIRYFANKQEDRWVLTALGNCLFELLDGDIPATGYIHVISGLTNSTIAFSEDVRWQSWKGSLGERQHMPDGARRFRLRDNRRKIEVESVGERTAWLSQALSVFHTLNISLDEAFSTTFIFPWLKLTGTLQKSKHKRQRRQLLHTPIYLIVLPSPYPLYHWSLDPTGQTPLSLEMCKYLGLPFKLLPKVTRFRESWPTKVYQQIHDYQIARMFDPKTTDFARSLGCPIFTIIPAENFCFQEIVEKHHRVPESVAKLSPNVNNSQEHSEPVPDSNVYHESRVEDRSPEETDDYFSLELLFEETEGSTKYAQRPNSASTPQDTMRSLLGTLLAPFTWEAIEGSGISAVVI